MCVFESLGDSKLKANRWTGTQTEADGMGGVSKPDHQFCYFLKDPINFETKSI